ncbi:MAG TPA: serine/threonine-protein kinase [Anaeromyxobacter sp.]|nr:serine/threonine-protein kinase [Anaeromyxobacter sp.]
MTDAGLPQVPGYEAQGLLGRGGMAEVYRARVCSGPSAGRTVALKRLLPALARDAQYVALFRQEAELTRRLHHQAIVEVLETGVSGGVPFIAMEYVDGRNLKEILAQCAGRGILLPVDFAAYVAHVLAEALSHAHEGWDEHGRLLGIVHNDVSPSNVFISRLGEIKLGDFGVARLLPGSPQALVDPGVTRAALASGPGAFGKIQYLAPELLRGGRPTPASDLFALGAVFFELLTNRRAFPGRDVNEVGRRILAPERPAPSSFRPEVPVALDALVLSCLQREPGRRVATASAFGADVAASYDPAVGTPLAIAAVVRGLFGVKG